MVLGSECTCSWTRGRALQAHAAKPSRRIIRTFARARPLRRHSPCMQTLYALTYATRKSEPAIIHDPHDLRTEIRITTGYREHAVVRVASSAELDTGCVRYRAGNHERKYAPLPARPFTGSYMYCMRRCAASNGRLDANRSRMRHAYAYVETPVTVLLIRCQCMSRRTGYTFVAHPA